MQSYLNELLERGILRIRNNVQEMSQLAEKALQDCVKALVEKDRKLAYAVILRDYYIDEKEKEVDRLCLEFIVRQQPVALPLRFAYNTIRINLQIERVGDYAVSIARSLIQLKKSVPEAIKDDIIDMAKISILMLHEATRAFLEQDIELAKKNIAVDDTVDELRTKCNQKLASLFLKQEIPLEDFDSLTTIVRRFERVSDQASNICLEVLHMCTGENPKHPGAAAFRILFLSNYNACRSLMAEIIAEGMDQPRFIFTSAGLSPRPVAESTLKFMKTKGFDLSRVAPRAFHSVPNLEYYDVIIVFSKEAMKAFPPDARKMIILDWTMDDPSQVQGSTEIITAAYEETYQTIKSHLNDLIGAIIGSEIK
ncbi:MAG: phosphate transport system regulatory protein PhoU [Desulfobacteraceae bacterium]|nr:MAG: phosphate transport system regulatory protein PhoU [Desulfobacteraceae bacterium]